MPGQECDEHSEIKEVCHYNTITADKTIIMVIIGCGRGRDVWMPSLLLLQGRHFPVE